jgi:hypothetical protein
VKANKEYRNKNKEKTEGREEIGAGGAKYGVTAG